MKYKRLIFLISTLLILIAGSLSGYCDIIYLDRGQIEGEIIEETSSSIVVKMSIGQVTIDKDRVDHIVRKPYETIDKKIDDSDAEVQRGEEQNRHFLWKITSDTSTSYILGSIHMAKLRLYPLDEVIEQAFDNSDKLVVEANIPQNPLGTQMHYLDSAVYTEGESLEKNLSERTFHLLEMTLEEMKLDISLFNRFRPWFVASVISTYMLQKTDYTILGIDLYFLGKAQDKKEIIELEGIKSQIDLLSGLSAKEQDLFLFMTLKNLDNLKENIDEMFTAWKCGDIDKMGKIITKEFDRFSEASSIYERIFIQRNKNMASKLDGLLKTPYNYFIVVGAGHLVGDKGLIQLLREKGYSLKQL